MDIDDVVNELTMIQRVHEDQTQVWEALHSDKVLCFDCNCNTDDIPRRLKSETTRLEEDAFKVRDSVGSFALDRNRILFIYR